MSIEKYSHLKDYYPGESVWWETTPGQYYIGRFGIKEEVVTPQRLYYECIRFHPKSEDDGSGYQPPPAAPFFRLDLPEWKSGEDYSVGHRVKHKGICYEATWRMHTSYERNEEITIGPVGEEEYFPKSANTSTPPNELLDDDDVREWVTITGPYAAPLSATSFINSSGGFDTLTYAPFNLERGGRGISSQEPAWEGGDDVKFKMKRWYNPYAEQFYNFNGKANIFTTSDKRDYNWYYGFGLYTPHGGTMEVYIDFEDKTVKGDGVTIDEESRPDVLLWEGGTTSKDFCGVVAITEGWNNTRPGAWVTFESVPDPDPPPEPDPDAPPPEPDPDAPPEPQSPYDGGRPPSPEPQLNPGLQVGYPPKEEWEMTRNIVFRCYHPLYIGKKLTIKFFIDITTDKWEEVWSYKYEQVNGEGPLVWVKDEVVNHTITYAGYKPPYRVVKSKTITSDAVSYYLPPGQKVFEYVVPTEVFSNTDYYTPFGGWWYPPKNKPEDDQQIKLKPYQEGPWWVVDGND